MIRTLLIVAAIAAAAVWVDRRRRPEPERELELIPTDNFGVPINPSTGKPFRRRHLYGLYG